MDQTTDKTKQSDRRGFLKNAATGAAGLAATAPIAMAQQATLKLETRLQCGSHQQCEAGLGLDDGRPQVARP